MIDYKKAFVDTAPFISKCDLFLTNDKQLRQFKEVKCITVDELG